MATVDTPSRRAPALPPDERRAAIVDATLPLLAQHGESVTSRQIAQAAGVAEGTIFRVFADKDALMTAVLEEALERASADDDYISIDPEVSVFEALCESVRILQRRIVDVWGVVANLRPELRQQIARPITDNEGLIVVIERYADELRVDPRRASRMLRALTLSVTHPMFVDEPLTADEIVDQFLHGAAAQGASR